MSIDVKAIEGTAEGIAAPILQNMGYALVACEFTFEEGRWILRLFIDKDGGVTIDDCVSASHAVEDVISVEDFIPASYNLEVSSPGLARPLKREEDFVRFAGERAKLKTSEPIDGRSNFKGVLAGVESGSVAISVDGTKFLVPMDKIHRARLEPEVAACKTKGH